MSPSESEGSDPEHLRQGECVLDRGGTPGLFSSADHGLGDWSNGQWPLYVEGKWGGSGKLTLKICQMARNWQTA